MLFDNNLRASLRPPLKKLSNNVAVLKNDKQSTDF